MKKVTLKSIAEEAGVSPMVVSAVVRDDFSKIRVGEDRRLKIKALLEHYNYVPNAAAKSLVSRKTKIINLFVPSMRFFEVPFQQKMITSLQEHLALKGYRISFYSFKTDQQENGFPSNVIADGALFFYYGSGNDEALEIVRRMPFPLLIFGHHAQHPNSVYLNNEAAMYALTTKVIAAGHRDILYMLANAGDIFNADGKTGVERAIAEHGISSFETCRVAQVMSTPFHTNRQYLMGAAAGIEILKRSKRPSVVIFSSDTVALSAVQYVTEHGLRVPEDISIVANGCDPYGDLIKPNLTRVSVDPIEVGAASAQSLLRLIEGESDHTLSVAFKMRIDDGETLRVLP